MSNEGKCVTGGLLDALVAPTLAANGYVTVVTTYLKLVAFDNEVAVGVDACVDDCLASAAACALYLVD